MSIPLVLYRISGWAIILTIVFLALSTLKTKRMWKGKYLYLGILFWIYAISNVISGITALFLINNLFLEHLAVPATFVLKGLYLRGQNKNQWLRNTALIIMIIFVIISVFLTFYKDGYKGISTLSTIISKSFFIVFTIINLTLLFRNKPEATKLRQNADFWFTATMLCFAFFGLLSSIIVDISYKAGSDNVLYAIFISENLINIIIYFGYFRAIKLLR
jgi:uncharacterized membrane protein YtjA (UPF0391 family)